MIVYHKYLFQVFFKLENVTCDRCPRLTTNSYDVNEEMQSVGITPDSFA